MNICARPSVIFINVRIIREHNLFNSINKHVVKINERIFECLVPRNYDPSLHPFEAAREYTRALNAVKLDRIFAKPFIGNLEGHKDGISAVCKHPMRLSVLISGAFDGELKVWNLSNRTSERSFLAHDGILRGIIFVPSGEHFITIGDDKTIKTWKAEKPSFGEEEEPVNTIISKVKKYK